MISTLRISSACHLLVDALSINEQKGYQNDLSVGMIISPTSNLLAIAAVSLLPVGVRHIQHTSMKCTRSSMGRL